jgi:hypothetical protein
VPCRSFVLHRDQQLMRYDFRRAAAESFGVARWQKRYSPDKGISDGPGPLLGYMPALVSQYSRAP